jgi:hypothetical protein
MRYRRTPDGRIETPAVLVAREYHRRLGETSYFDASVSDIDEDTIPEIMYHKALQRGLCSSLVTCNSHQIEACKFLDTYSNTVNAIVFRPPGSGKSFMWNGILLARYLRGSKRKRFIVLSPHSALLAQHVLLSQDFFRGTSLKVTSITASTIEVIGNMDDFDLCYISIHAFAKLVDQRENLIAEWEIGTIYIDEIHLLFCKLFRIGDAWGSIHDIQRLGSKVVCLSATINETAMKVVADYLGIGDNYAVIGDAASYSPPNVAILVKKVQEKDLLKSVIEAIKLQIDSAKKSRKVAIHVMTMTKKQATDIAEKLEVANIKSTWLTSDS